MKRETSQTPLFCKMLRLTNPFNHRVLSMCFSTSARRDAWWIGSFMASMAKHSAIGRRILTKKFQLLICWMLKQLCIFIDAGNRSVYCWYFPTFVNFSSMIEN